MVLKLSDVYKWISQLQPSHIVFLLYSVFSDNQFSDITSSSNSSTHFP